jgi:hypothetical protein
MHFSLPPPPVGGLFRLELDTCLQDEVSRIANNHRNRMLSTCYNRSPLSLAEESKDPEPAQR